MQVALMFGNDSNNTNGSINQFLIAPSRKYLQKQLVENWNRTILNPYLVTHYAIIIDITHFIMS